MFNLLRGSEKLHGTGNLVDINQIPFLYVQEEACLALWNLPCMEEGCICYIKKVVLFPVFVFSLYLRLITRKILLSCFINLALLVYVFYVSSMLIFWQLISTAFYFEVPNHLTVQVFPGFASFFMSSLTIVYSDIKSLTLQLHSLHHISQQTFVRK